MATIAQLRSGLAKSTVPDDVAKALLKGASPLWLSSDTAVQLAEDLALCHPELKPNEVRARAVAGDDMWRLTVVAHDRKGLLADTAAFLAVDGYSVRAASVATWKELDLAYHALTVDETIPHELWEQAVATWGEAGAMDLVFTVGWWGGLVLAFVRALGLTSPAEA